jgi:putative sugar O-methyltransferase
MRIELPKWGSDRFDVDADMGLLQSLTEDMENHSNSLGVPASWWLLPKERVKGTMADLMEAWCGCVGELPLSDLGEIAKVSGSSSMIASYEAYLRSIDHQRLLHGISLKDLGNANWRVMDLGSLMDYLLVSAFLDVSKESLRVLEVGGGFGRLAEFLALTGGLHLQYVNIDAVPASLMYSHQYLKHQFPNRKVTMFSPDRGVDSDCDFLVVPAWHLEQLQLSNFDLGINIESMQEMSQELVDNYLGYFEKKVRSDGLIYLVNSKDYKFQGSWNIPDNWQCLFRHRTPRSWSLNHPAEIFRRTTHNQSSQNMLRTANFEQELALHKGGSPQVEVKAASYAISGNTEHPEEIMPLGSHGAVNQSKSYKSFPPAIELIQSRFGPLVIPIKDVYAGQSLKEYGEFRQRELELFQQLISPGAVVLDIGAHVGAHTVPLAQLVGSGGVVVAFEPQPALHNILNANLVLNSVPNVLTYAMALGNSEGEFRITHPGSSQLDPNPETSVDALEGGDSVPLVQLDGFQLDRVDFIRLHAEGFGPNVVEGAANTIERCRPIIYVESERPENFPELIQRLFDLSYRLWWHTSPFVSPGNFKGNQENVFHELVSVNILAIPFDMRPIEGLQPILTPDDSWARET